MATVNPQGARNTSIYDPAARPIASENPLGHRTTSVLDTAGRTIATVDSLGHRSSFTFDTADQQISMTDALGRRTSSVFDPAGRVTASIDPLGNRTTFSYDPAGQQVAVENSFGARTTHLYNAAGQVSASVNPLEARSSQVYDAAGRPVARINPLGARVTSLFDAAGQMVAMQSPLGFRTTFGFDSVGRHSVTTDANGHSSTNVYDAASRGIASENALGHRATNILDVAGQLRAVQDARGNLWSFTYDPAGMRTQQIDPLGRITTSGYDPAGRQVLRIDARGNPTTYSFDPVEQLTRRWYPDNIRATFLFDSVGNRTGMRDTTGVYTYTFDALNQFAFVNQSSVGIITYSFDDLGRRRSMIAPTGGYFSYAYDQANRLAWMSNPEGDRTTISYDLADRRTLKELANGTRASFTYDAADQILQLFNLKSDDSMVSGFTYAMDAAGNRTNVLEGTGERITWTYDRTNQLTSEHRSGAHAYFHTFVYDPVGNRLVKLEDGAAMTFTYDPANQVRMSTDETGQSDYLFDANGNHQVVIEPSGARTTWSWNYENQPPLVEFPHGQRLIMAYNAAFHRTFKDEPDCGLTRFVWDHVNDSYLLELDNSGALSVTYTNQPFPFDNLVSQYVEVVSSYYHFDGQGSTRQLTDTSESVTDEYTSTAFGTSVVQSGTTVNPFVFIGISGYYTSIHFSYVRRRYYVPKLVRWQSVDPRKDQQSTQYGYARNNPITNVDPSGEEPIFTGCVGGIILAGVASYCAGEWANIDTDYCGRDLTNAEASCITAAHAYASSSLCTDRGTPRAGRIPVGGAWRVPYRIGQCTPQNAPWTYTRPFPCRHFTTWLPPIDVNCTSCGGFVNLIATLIHESYHWCQWGFESTVEALECPAYKWEAEKMRRSIKIKCAEISNAGYCGSKAECEQEVNDKIREAEDYMNLLRCDK